MQEYVKIEMDADEFNVVMRNLDLWERKMSVKFIEADVTGGKAIVKAMPVASTGFFVWVWNEEARLMAELRADSRIGYIDLEELANFDPELLERLKHSIVYDENHGTTNMNGRYFPKTQCSVKLFKILMRTAKWKSLSNEIF
jgi:hypothetical protein